MNTELLTTNTATEIKETNHIRTRRQAYCHLCRKRVGLLSEANAAFLLQTNEPAISRLISCKAVHRIHNSKGVKMICENALRSIERCFRISRTITLRPIEIKD